MRSFWQYVIIVTDFFPSLHNHWFNELELGKKRRIILPSYPAGYESIVEEQKRRLQSKNKEVEFCYGIPDCFHTTGEISDFWLLLEYVYRKEEVMIYGLRKKDGTTTPLFEFLKTLE